MKENIKFTITYKICQVVRSSELLAKLELEDLYLILRERRLCWFGNVECFSGAVRTAYDIQINGRRGREAQANMEKANGERLHEWKITTVEPQERSTWISGVISAMHAASQLPGRGTH